MSRRHEHAHPSVLTRYFGHDARRRPTERTHGMEMAATLSRDAIAPGRSAERHVSRI
jgi:hypothetical protein